MYERACVTAGSETAELKLALPPRAAGTEGTARAVCLSAEEPDTDRRARN